MTFLIALQCMAVTTAAISLVVDLYSVRNL